MSNKQFITKGIISAALSCFSVVAFANELTIVNNTHQPSTSKIIRGKSQYCTNRMTNGKGVTGPLSENVVSENSINYVCYKYTEDCLAYVYMNDHCGDPFVAAVRFSISSGILTPPVMVPGSGYVIDAPVGSFRVVINESPTVSATK